MPIAVPALSLSTARSRVAVTEPAPAGSTVPGCATASRDTLGPSAIGSVPSPTPPGPRVATVSALRNPLARACRATNGTPQGRAAPVRISIMGPIALRVARTVLPMVAATQQDSADVFRVIGEAVARLNVQVGRAIPARGAEPAMS